MADLSTGADAVGGERFGNCEYNDIKNHWRMSDPCSNLANIQPGMIVSDSDDEKLYHYQAAACEEILQSNTLFDGPALISDDAQIIGGDGSDSILIPYEETTNDAVIWGLPVSPKRGLIFCDVADIGNDFTGIITASAQVQLHIVDLDNDSVFSWGFYSDDVGLLTVPANPLREQILFNSGIGYWPQSDTNKGIGYLDFDSGSVEPVVGETLTDATSGAVGKVQWVNVSGGTWGGGDAAGTVYLGACSRDVCFQDNADVNGSTGGANMMTVNQPDGAVGTDGIVENGAFVTDNDPPNDWTAVAAALLTTEGAGKVGNCLMITETGTINPYARQIVTVEVGKIYTFTTYVKAGTEATYRVLLSDATSYDTGSIEETAGDWSTQEQWTFEAETTSLTISLYNRAAAGSGLTMYFDEVTVYEIQPCCTAADSLALEGWQKDTAMDLYREHNGANTKEGSYYALKCVPDTAVKRVFLYALNAHDLEEILEQYRGLTICIGGWVRTSTASHARIRISDGVGTTYSDYHSGGGTYEWLEIPRTIDTAATVFTPFFTLDAAPNIDGTTIVYISQPILVYGASIGEGNYRPRQQEFLWGSKSIPSLTYDNTTDWSDLAFTDINLEADSDAMIPKGVKMIAVNTEIEDSGSGAGLDVHLELRKDATAGHFFENSVAGKPNDIHAHISGFQSCDEYGDIDIHLDASGANTLDVDELQYKGVQIN